MLLFAASTNLSYRMFTDANEKFISVFVRVFTTQMPHGASLSQIQLQTGKLSCKNETWFYAFCISAPDRFGLVFYDVINYNDVISAKDSHESVKNTRFTDV